MHLGALLLAGLALIGGCATAAERLVVGSKRFTESYILGDILARTAERGGAEAVHRPGLGNTAVVLAALKAGAIDVYPEYLGTTSKRRSCNCLRAATPGAWRRSCASSASPTASRSASRTATPWRPRPGRRKPCRCGP